ncbi:uncharacterized protein A4U43_C02F11940 [Asparagus officinalis]|uniref:BAR domain-containing protein n=2 Tax=Asparagus officinalis TaxID=4686 RepID=A0A5P1FMI2_ASPOF|nr:uncharacterized protein At2g33490-like isoform X2 [Asparagus officinalis]ONK77891.1 uncharacterized protein A4U43_C02F11940 [Asparagus officinalis]
MKSPLRKLRGLASNHKSDSKDKKDHRHHDRQPAMRDELVHATQDMLDMKRCYDSLLSAAAATTNSAYELSEALEEMGTCLLKKTALNEDEDSGRVLLMLGKVQFELQKLMDSYRMHIVQTITTPSESLLKELQTVEEMKQQCDVKRDLYKIMLERHREKGRKKHVKGESVSSKQLQDAREDYEEEANLFIFRLKSLKQGQSRSILTQAARHHAAQLNFFRKGFKYLEVVEPQVKAVASQEHIDYQFNGLEDDDTEEYDDYDDDDDDYYSYDSNDKAELSLDYRQDDKDQDALSSSTSSMELNQVEEPVIRASKTEPAKLMQENVDRNEAEVPKFYKRPSPRSHSAPIFPDKVFDPKERIKQLRPSSTRKFHTYALPTPVDVKHSVSIGSVGKPSQLWHSSPLEPYKFIQNSRDDVMPSLAKFPKAHTVKPKESNINSSPIRMPPPLSEELARPHFSPQTGSNVKKVRQYAYSGPLTSGHWSNKPDDRDVMLPCVRTPQPSLSPTATCNISPPPMISELHELPRPPIGLVRSTRPASLIGHSAPLVYQGQDPNKRTGQTSPFASCTASPLPTPPAAVRRSFSIPSRRMPLSQVAQFLEDTSNKDLIEDFAPRHLPPICLKNIYPASRASESVTRATKEKEYM